MAGTYSQIYIQIVFSVKYRESVISPRWEEELYKYISGIVRNKGQKLLAINGVPDHIHLLIGLKPSACLSDLVREIKKSSSDFVNHKNLTRSRFQWQEGYGAFSYSHSAIDQVIQYIQNQKEHHRKQNFREEYLELLSAYQVEFNEPYLFEWLENDYKKI